MKRKNILKKSSRSVLSISMCIIILFGTFIIGESANASTSNYSHSAAVDYAKKHWNDGVGLCAQFVAACITAGGISVSDKVCYNLYNSLKPYGTVYKLKTYVIKRRIIHCSIFFRADDFFRHLKRFVKFLLCNVDI